MNTVAVIPARGGSKRIPRKNIKSFAGKPIIGYSIEAAVTSELFDRIIVSTDDKEIADVAQAFGAEVPFLRQPELADDFTGTNPVVKHCLQWLYRKGYEVEYACCIYATAPFIRVEDLKYGLQRLRESGKDFAFSVTSFAFPIQRALRINNEGCLEAYWPENATKRSQDLEEAYHDAGQFYWGKASSFCQDIPLYSTHSVPTLLPRIRVQDIDTMEDWTRAEIMFTSLRG